MKTALPQVSGVGLLPPAVLIEELNRSGFITLPNIDEDSFIALAHAFGTIVPHPDADPKTGITHITSDSSHLSYEDGRAALPLHTDGTAVANPADILLFRCEVPAERGGISTYADSREIFTYIMKKHSSIASLLLSEPVLFGDPKMTQYQSPFFYRVGSEVCVRFRDDGFLIIPDSLKPHLALFRTILQQHTRTVFLKSNQAYIALNKRVLHGREAFDGDMRHMQRILVRYDPSPAFTGIHMGFDVRYTYGI